MPFSQKISRSIFESLKNTALSLKTPSNRFILQRKMGTKKEFCVNERVSGIDTWTHCSWRHGWFFTEFIDHNLEHSLESLNEFWWFTKNAYLRKVCSNKSTKIKTHRKKMKKINYEIRKIVVGWTAPTRIGCTTEWENVLMSVYSWPKCTISRIPIPLRATAGSARAIQHK